ncbi:MAG: hypothetical protein ACJ74W_03525 [Pyrinomonadaceae bacterium]
MNTFRIVVGIVSLIYAFVILLRGEWLGFVQFSAMGWSLLLDPTKPSTAKLRARLMLVALVCALLRYLI